jgi:hypothetical protein
MAKPGASRTSSGNAGTLVIARPHSHKITEGLLLLSALGILCVLFSFFAIELQNISVHALTYRDAPKGTSSSPLMPPRIEARVIGPDLVLTEVDEAGQPVRELYSSDLTDEIADFTLFAIPQTGYQGYVYIRPLVDGDLPLLKIYPLEVATGTLKAATLNVAASIFTLSTDQTLVATYADGNISLYALEDGVAVTAGSVSTEWRERMESGTSDLMITENSCLSLSLPITEPDVEPFSPLCP